MGEAEWWPECCGPGPLEALDREVFALVSSRVVLPCDEASLFEVVPATVLVRSGVIEAVWREGEAVALPEGCEVRDCGSYVLL